MELINTICTNWVSFMNVVETRPIGWIHGPGWTLGYAAIMAPMMVRWTWQGIQSDRRSARGALYREAEAAGQARVEARDRLGGLEIISW